MEIMESMLDQELPDTMGFDWIDVSFQQSQSKGEAVYIFLFAVIMVYLVLAAQYESWTIPVSVCLAVPTALLGAELDDDAPLLTHVDLDGVADAVIASVLDCRRQRLEELGVCETELL